MHSLLLFKSELMLSGKLPQDIGKRIFAKI
jgi:hypothetical protein